MGPLTSLIISTYNISGFGMSQKVGHLDFYPNGGKQMPGCQKNALSTIIDINGIWEVGELGRQDSGCSTWGETVRGVCQVFPRQCHEVFALISPILQTRTLGQ